MIKPAPVRAFASLFVLFSAACASQAAPDKAAGTAPAAVTVAPSTDVSGTWEFVLDSSDPAPELRERCAREGDGDEAKSVACYAEIREEASHEKVRFTRLDGATYRFTSFAEENGKDDVFVEAPIELSSDGAGHLLAKLAGAPTGKFSARMKGQKGPMRIEIVDETTISMNDPQKGRLVFTKE